MNLPKISFSKPQFTSRFFIYLLFGLVLLILLIEGGYYYFSQIKGGARTIHTDWVNLIEGEIKAIKGRTLVLAVKDNSLIPKKVEIEVSSDVRVFIPPSLELLEKVTKKKEMEKTESTAQLEVPMESIEFTDLKVGDVIQAGILTKLAETKFKAESIAVIEK